MAPGEIGVKVNLPLGLDLAAKGGFQDLDVNMREVSYITYTNTWPIVAARVLDRPNTGRPTLEGLRDRRVEKTGGFLINFATQHADRRQDIVTISGLRQCLSGTGRTV